MKAKVINKYAKHYGEIIDVDLVWIDSYQDDDEVQYGKDELEFIDKDQ